MPDLATTTWLDVGWLGVRFGLLTPDTPAFFKADLILFESIIADCQEVYLALALEDFLFEEVDWPEDEATEVDWPEPNLSEVEASAAVADLADSSEDEATEVAVLVFQIAVLSVCHKVILLALVCCLIHPYYLLLVLLAVLAALRNALAVGAPLVPGLRIFSPLPALIRRRLA